jgi:hypothetical protein
MLLYEFFNKTKMNEDVQSDRIDFIVNQIRTNPEVTKKVYRLVQNEVDSIAGKSPKDLLAPELTKPEQDHTVKGLLGTFIRALNDTPGDYDDFSTFLTTYGKVSYIDEAELMKPGYSGWGAWLKGNGKVSEGFITQLYKNLFDTKLNINKSNRGPGEVGLALLSPNIKFASLGDLNINGVEVEVKGEISSGGGRLKNNLKDFGKPNLDAIYAKAELTPEEIPVGFPTGNAGARGRDHFQDVAKMLDTKQNMLGQEYMKELFTGFFINGDPELINNIVANYDRLDRATISSDAMKIAYSSYANILKTKNFSKFLLLKLQGEKSLAFDVNDWQDYLEYFKLGSLDFNDTQNGPAVQISML